MLSLTSPSSYLSLLLFTTQALSSCECGYTLSSPQANSSVTTTALFTEALETDFLHVYTLPGYNTSTQARIASFGWQAQAYNVSPSEARGPYGKAAEVQNVIPNPLGKEWDWGGESIKGGDPGLQLWVRGRDDLLDLQGGGQAIRSAELASVRLDMGVGSYRVGMKMPSVSGTCAAFFWFRNDTSEIDIEFLQREVNASSSPVNLVLQTPESAEQGYDASKTPYFKVQPLPFVPSGDYHEYRFDWLPGSVTFFADGVPLFSITNVSVVPTDPGHLIVNHWSNGDPNWSGGPPDQDAVATVSYVKAYFNSSDPMRQENFTATCRPGGEVCSVVEPDFGRGISPLGSGGNQTGRTPFLTPEPGWTTGQSEGKSAGVMVRSGLWMGVGVALVVGLML